LRTERLSKTYPDGDVHALVDVSFEIPRGDYLAIMGPSGCGKSTLLNLLGGLDRPTSGEVYFEGQPLSTVRNLDQFRSRKVGFIFQSFLLLPTLSALENVQVPMFGGPLSASQRAAKARDLLGVVGLSHRLNHRPHGLSVGERQRVAIARALANDPPFLLADEPTGNLDSRTADQIFDLFDHLLRERGLTLVVVTHSEPLGKRARRILRLKDGRIENDQAASSSP
jgi:putative ABC transport system ATP-binding protein